MDRLPFDAYDFFGYLASGLLVLVGMEFAFGFPHVLGRDFKVIDAALLILATYIAGQLIATPAKTVPEDGLIDKVLGRPNTNLFREKRPRWALLFPGFYVPFPEHIRKKILVRAASTQPITSSG